MEKTNEIFKILAEKSRDRKLTPQCDSLTELVTTLLSALFGIAFFVAVFKNWNIAALACGTIGIIALLILNIISVTKDSHIYKNPVKTYIGQLSKSLSDDKVIYDKLLSYPTETLIDTKSILEFELARVDNHTRFIVGAFDKVGLIPSVVALFFSFYSYQVAVEHTKLSFFLLALLIGIYLGVLIIQRVTKWQTWAIFLLSKAIDNGITGEDDIV